jgi:hypothetical protein
MARHPADQLEPAGLSCLVYFVEGTGESAIHRAIAQPCRRVAVDEHDNVGQEASAKYGAWALDESHRFRPVNAAEARFVEGSLCLSGRSAFDLAQCSTAQQYASLAPYYTQRVRCFADDRSAGAARRGVCLAQVDAEQALRAVPHHVHTHHWIAPRAPAPSALAAEPAAAAMPTADVGDLGLRPPKASTRAERHLAASLAAGVSLALATLGVVLRRRAQVRSRQPEAACADIAPLGPSVLL